MKPFVFAAALLSGLTAANMAGAMSTPGQNSANETMFEFGQSRPPIGYVQFCETFPEECEPMTAGPSRIHLSEDAWTDLVEINDHVNATVEPVSDLELYGVVEWWAYPLANQGDCEAYVLEKRRMLLERGWPASALLITVVLEEDGAGHAVLTVTTDRGDLVLDNQHPDIRLWSNTPYAFLKRQSKVDPNGWVSLRDARPRPDLPVAGTNHY